MTTKQTERIPIGTTTQLQPDTETEDIDTCTEFEDIDRETLKTCKVLPVNYKQCKKCNKVFPYNNTYFYIYPYAPNKSVCKQCETQRAKDSYNNHHARLKKYYTLSPQIRKVLYQELILHKAKPSNVYKVYEGVLAGAGLAQAHLYQFRRANIITDPDHDHDHDNSDGSGDSDEDTDEDTDSTDGKE